MRAAEHDSTGVSSRVRRRRATIPLCYIRYPVKTRPLLPSAQMRRFPDSARRPGVKARLLCRPSGAQDAGTRQPLRRAGQPGGAGDPRAGVPRRAILDPADRAARASSAMPGPFAEPVGHPRGCRRHRALRLPDRLRQCGLCAWARSHRGSPVLVALPPRVL